MRATRKWLLAGVGALLLGQVVAWRIVHRWEREEAFEAAEEHDAQRDNFWRARVVIVGRGRVKTFVAAFDCASEGAGEHGDCGPKLVRFKELAPPTMEAQPATGWRFDHWDAQIRDADGKVHGRAGKMPDGRVYIDGFGFEDTGQLETVTAVFVEAIDASPVASAQLGVQP